MKRFFAIAIIFLCATSFSYTQNLKFGHINGSELLQSLPEWDSATVRLERYRQELVNALELMSVDLNNKNDAYNKEEKNLTDLVKQTKQQEIIDLNRRIQEFQTNAQEQLQTKQAEYFRPIQEKVDKAIKDVGKENGFTYIMDVSSGVLLYFDETKSTNIMPLAKAKLGIK
jgi:outer membrane protein